MPELVLVTGGTGAIGAPLARALAEAGVPAAVLARRAGAASSARCLRGDILGGDTLGLDAATVSDLRSQVTTIVHAAALTRFDADPEEARRVNVEGTRNVLAFAAGCSRLERFCALSTVYVAGRRTGTIRESDLLHDRGFVNPYEASKYEAEQLLRDWMARLPIGVLRLSTALGDSATGRVERPAAIHQAVRFLYGGLLPMIPGTPESPVDLTSTDYAVAAIRHLAGEGFVPGGTFHVCAGDEAPGEEALIDMVIAAFLEYRPAWRRRTIERPTIVPLETFELFRASVEAVADSALRATVGVLGHFAPQLAYPKVFDDRRCRAALAAAGIRRPAVEPTVRAVVKYLIEHQWHAQS
jgi:nucleoside-diphosphate-sugar epimerase